jgi:hypothetical protein
LKIRQQTFSISLYLDLPVGMMHFIPVGQQLKDDPQNCAMSANILEGNMIHDI